VERVAIAPLFWRRQTSCGAHLRRKLWHQRVSGGAFFARWCASRSVKRGSGETEERKYGGNQWRENIRQKQYGARSILAAAIVAISAYRSNGAAYQHHRK